MGRRSTVRLEDVAALDNLAAAFWRAARGKRRRPDVAAFAARLDAELAALQAEILAGRVPVGTMRVFRIRDPKPRTIHAPCFRERVLHHALMAHVGPVLERSLVADTFACRPGRGTLAAVRRAQELSRRHPVVAKLDVRAYFASIDHGVLLSLLRRRIQGAGVLGLLQRIVHSHQAAPGRGLPIGALTSQHLANLYLAGVDRRVLDGHGLGLVRYMDDVLVWGPDFETVRRVVGEVVGYAAEVLRLEIKPGWQPVRVGRGVPLCGFRVYPDRLLLTPRRQRRYRQARRRWEAAYGLGLIDARTLQAGYAAARAVTAHADAAEWRRSDLERREPPDA